MISKDIPQKPIKGNGFVVTKSSPVQTILNGPRSIDGIPSFQVKVDATEFKAKRLARYTFDLLKDCKYKIQSVLNSLNRDLPRYNGKAIKPFELLYSTQNIAKDYRGPVVLLVPEIHLHDYDESLSQLEAHRNLYESMKLGVSKEMMFSHIELFRKLVEEGLFKNCVYESANMLPKSGDSFDELAPLKTGFVVSAFCGMPLVNVEAGEKPKSYAASSIRHLIWMAIMAKLNSDIPGAQALDIKTTLKNLNHVLLESAKMSKSQYQSYFENEVRTLLQKLKLENIVSFDIENAIDNNHQAITVGNKIFSLNQKQIESIMKYLSLDSHELSSYQRDQDIRKTVQSFHDTGIVPIVIGAAHTPNLVVNELEANGIPVIVVSAYDSEAFCENELISSAKQLVDPLTRSKIQASPDENRKRASALLAQINSNT